jgi:phage terminase large subunit-like protein
MNIVPIERTSASGSKTTRFLEMQQYIASKLVSIPFGAKHTQKCIDHMCKITSNDTHKNDDICDTCYDAVKLALIDRLATTYVADPYCNKEKADTIMRQQKIVSLDRQNRWA